jgi:hypothetical protein
LVTASGGGGAGDTNSSSAIGGGGGACIVNYRYNVVQGQQFSYNIPTSSGNPGSTTTFFTNITLNGGENYLGINGGSAIVDGVTTEGGNYSSGYIGRHTTITVLGQSCDIYSGGCPGLNNDDHGYTGRSSGGSGTTGSWIFGNYYYSGGGGGYGRGGNGDENMSPSINYQGGGEGGQGDGCTHHGFIQIDEFISMTPPGWSHKITGIVASKIMGIVKANVKKVMGIS